MTFVFLLIVFLILAFLGKIFGNEKEINSQLEKNRKLRDELEYCQKNKNLPNGYAKFKILSNYQNQPIRFEIDNEVWSGYGRFVPKKGEYELSMISYSDDNKYFIENSTIKSVFVINLQRNYKVDDIIDLNLKYYKLEERKHWAYDTHQILNWLVSIY